MQIIAYFNSLFNQINIMIEKIVNGGGGWAYLIMFLILYVGAAVIVTAPFLPSVSLIFMIVSLCVAGLLNPFMSVLALAAAVVLGDLTGYFIGKLIGDKLIDKNRIPFIKANHIEQSRKLYDGVSLLTMIFARFTPMIGSLAQLIAGAVNYKLDAFLLRNVIAGVIWLIVHLIIGWVLAVIPAFKNNYILITLLVPVFSGMVTVFYFVKKSLRLMAATGKASECDTK
jgi:membrane-associated protein